MFQSVNGEVKIVPSLYKTKGLISDIALQPPGTSLLREYEAD